MISQNTLQEIRTRVRLVDLVSGRVELKQRGANFVGLCPFHNEKSPSFNVQDSNNRYVCYGCGVSGDVITFVMETEGLSFPEAVEMLAARGKGLHTCPQAAFAWYHEVVRQHVPLPPEHLLVCGIALGHEDSEAAVNTFATPREPVRAFASFHGFETACEA